MSGNNMDRGVVKRTENGFAFIEMELNASCRSCSNKGVCMAGDSPAELKIEDQIGLKAGDLVEIELGPQTKIFAGFLLFIFPIISMLACYYIAFTVWKTEEAGMLGALTGLVIGVFDLILINKFVSKRRYFKPVSVKKIG
jgi:positive regulator of sigma E activity